MRRGYIRLYKCVKYFFSWPPKLVGLSISEATTSRAPCCFPSRATLCCGTSWSSASCSWMPNLQGVIFFCTSVQWSSLFCSPATYHTNDIRLRRQVATLLLGGVSLPLSCWIQSPVWSCLRSGAGFLKGNDGLSQKHAMFSNFQGWIHSSSAKSDSLGKV